MVHLRLAEIGLRVAARYGFALAGGYAVQDHGEALVASIEGDYWNVVGLPVSLLFALRPELNP